MKKLEMLREREFDYASAYSVLCLFGASPRYCSSNREIVAGGVKFSCAPGKLSWAKGDIFSLDELIEIIYSEGLAGEIGYEPLDITKGTKRA